MKSTILAAVFAIITIGGACAAQQQSNYDLLVKSLPWRSIGPAVMGGRVDDFAVVESNPAIFYVGTAAGGVFKTTNHGTTFEPVFDSQSCLSIGDVTLAPSNPDIVWVGTGEANNRQSSSWGSGVYKSTDAGKTWAFMGLPESRHIGRIVIDSKNPDMVFVAAGGDLWASSSDRGVYKTADGGKTWVQSLTVNQDTGCTDLAMDPQNPSIIYAAMYQRRRTAAGFNGGGPGSGIFKTIDSGAHWTRLTKGLPTGDTGRIGLDVYRKNPSIVYACVENTDGGIYRSEDQGESWKKMGAVNMGLNAFRPMYFSQIRVDPSNDMNLIMAGVSMGWSGDGGKTLETFPGSRIHPDVHAIWIDPANSKHVLVGCDGGIQWTFDQGRTWDFVGMLPIAQFYEVTADMRKPYWVYGGLQDNGSWGAPSMALSGRGITNADWINVGGGDGFYCQADPMDSDTVYSESQQGAVGRLNVATGERKSIRPTPPPGTAPYRFDWNTPILISHHNHNRIYLGGNRLFISEDRGDSWRFTPDLTTNPDRDKMAIMGILPAAKPLSLNDGQDSFGEIVTISESPAQAGVLWVGTDDGCVQVSRDDGKTWTNVADRLSGVSKGIYVTRVLASSYAAGRAYVTLDGHRNGDIKPHLFVTEDYGATWQAITNGISDHNTVKAIREHPRNPALLFAGTERGAFVSFDRGAAWTRLGTPLPAVPVNDIQIHPRENDLILATHGRGIWILDDISVFEEIASRPISGKFLLCSPRPAVEYRSSFGQSWGGNRVFFGDNPPYGASIEYYIPAALPPNTSAKLTILDRAGKHILSEFRTVATEPGVHRVRWDMRNSGPAPAPGLESDEEISDAAPGAGADADDGDALLQIVRRTFAVCQAAETTAAPQAGQATSTTTAPQAGQGTGRGGRRGQGGAAGGGRQGGGQGGGPGGRQGGGRGGFGPRVLPGVYLVRMTIGSDEQTREIRVEDDPRVHISDRDRRAQYDLQLRLMHLSQSYSDARRDLTALRTGLTELQKSPEVEKAPAALKQTLAEFDKEVQSAQKVVTDGRSAQAKPETESTSAQGATTAEATATRRPAAPTGVILGRMNRLMASLNSITEPPSKYLRQETDGLADVVRQAVAAVNALNTNDVARVNRMLTDNKLKTLPTAQAIERPR